jgi:hypothetical protein
LPAIAASAKKTGVPPIAGTPWAMIQADLERDTTPEQNVIQSNSRKSVKRFSVRNCFKTKG